MIIPEVLLCSRSNSNKTLRRLVTLSPQLAAKAIRVGCGGFSCSHLEEQQQQHVLANNGATVTSNGAAAAAAEAPPAAVPSRISISAMRSFVLAAPGLTVQDLGAISVPLQAVKELCSAAFSTATADAAAGPRPLQFLEEITLRAPYSDDASDAVDALVMGCPRLRSITIRGNSAEVGDRVCEAVTEVIFIAFMPEPDPGSLPYRRCRPRPPGDVTLARCSSAEAFLKQLQVFDVGASEIALLGLFKLLVLVAQDRLCMATLHPPAVLPSLQVLGIDTPGTPAQNLEQYVRLFCCGDPILQSACPALRQVRTAIGTIDPAHTAPSPTGVTVLKAMP
eukprot:m51a1_g2780 hypothetical protein (336) ;mRNA; r:1069427-1070434